MSVSGRLGRPRSTRQVLPVQIENPREGGHNRRGFPGRAELAGAPNPKTRRPPRAQGCHVGRSVAKILLSRGFITTRPMDEHGWRQITVNEAEPALFLIRRVRAGDSEAATELVRRYEPLIRAPGARLVAAELSRAARRASSRSTSASRCCCSFFVRVAAGQFDLETPGATGRAAGADGAAQAARPGQASPRRTSRRPAEREGGSRVGRAAAREPTRSACSSASSCWSRSAVASRTRSDSAADLRGEGRTWAGGRRRDGRHARGPPQATGPGARPRRPGARHRRGGPGG